MLYSRILLPVDGSPHAARAIEQAIHLAEGGGTIIVATIVPVIPEVNGDDEEMGKIIRFVKEYAKPVKISLLPYHNTGKDKAVRVGAESMEFSVPTGERMEELKALWLQAGFREGEVQIGG